MEFMIGFATGFILTGIGVFAESWRRGPRAAWKHDPAIDPPPQIGWEMIKKDLLSEADLDRRLAAAEYWLIVRETTWYEDAEMIAMFDDPEKRAKLRDAMRIAYERS